MFIMAKQIPQFCATHRTRAMVDVHNARCVEEGCKKQAIFGVRSSKVSSVHTAAVYCIIVCNCLP
jgi:hypothetical protein